MPIPVRPNRGWRGDRRAQEATSAWEVQQRDGGDDVQSVSKWIILTSKARTALANIRPMGAIAQLDILKSKAFASSVIVGESRLTSIQLIGAFPGSPNASSSTATTDTRVIERLDVEAP